MFESFDFQQMISAFIVLFAVIDIIGSIPIIINLKEKGKDVNAMKATVISFLLMIGRIIGSWIMSYIRAEKVLFICAIFTVLGALFVTLNLGTLSKGALFACYIFEAIMFPTIFAISLRGLGDYTKRASSFLMMSPIGGAVGPLLMGYVADISTMSFSFVVPLFGYAVVLIYSYMVMAKKLR